jgi:transposase
MRPKGSSVELERRRRDAVALLKRGVKVSVVAKALRVSVVSVGRWRKAVRNGAIAALAAKPHSGRPPKMTDIQRRRLTQVLLKGPRYHGFATELWTLDRVAMVVERKFGVHYHPSAIWHILKGLGWSCQKPQCRARERDEEVIRRWRRYKWPNIKKGRESRENDTVSG